MTVTGTSGGTFAASGGLSIDAGSGLIDLGASTPATYTVTYTFTDGNGCSNSATTSVTINALPTATINYAGSPYCATGSAAVTLTGTTGGTFASSGGLSIDAGSGLIDLAASTPAAYTVTYTFTDGNGCSNSTTATVIVSALPTATISYAGSPYCATGSAAVTLTGTTGGTFASSGGLSIDAGSGLIDLAASTPAAYTVTYTFTDGNGCSNSTTATVIVSALPTATISYAGSPYCPTGTVGVTVTGTSGGTFSSSAGLSIDAGSGLIDLGASTPAAYTVTYTFSGNGCSNTATTSVTVNALPTATISYAGSPYCATSTAAVTLTGTTGGAFTSAGTLSINAGSGLIDLAASTPGTYTVTYAFTDGNGCSNSATTSITINALPTATVGSDTTFCSTVSTITGLLGDNGTIGGSATQGQWTFTPNNPAITISQTGFTANPGTVTAGATGGFTGVITFTLTSNDPFGCGAGSDSFTVTISGNQPATTWTGAIDSNWHDGRNWTNCAPGPTTVTTIAATANDPQITSADGDCLNITIQNGANLNITGSRQLNVYQ